MTTTTSGDLVSPPTRPVDGVQLPAVGTWMLDPGHAEIGFVGRHLVFTKVRGRFRGVDGRVEVAADPNQTTVEVTIDMTSVDSGDDTRDDHLRSADLFDVATYPTATFRGRAQGWSGRAGTLDGELTIKGIAKPLTLEVSHLGQVRDPWGNDRASFSASGTLNREDWGIGWNVVLDGGGLLVSKEVRIEIEIETVRQP
jgi:polyisoprenoid-binding protein YceI